MGDAVAMSSIARVGVPACVALLLAGCASYTSWMPSWTLDSLGPRSSGASVSLTVESDPPGADARTSIGPTCRTPCMIPVPADQPFTVTYSLNGYISQSVEVRPRPTDPTRPEVETGGAAASAEVTPNPVYVQLDPAPPPAPTKRRPLPKKAAPKKS